MRVSPARLSKLSLEHLEDRCVPSATLLRDINASTHDSSPDRFLAADGKVFFLAVVGEAGRQLHATDGTAAGTVRLTNLPSGFGLDSFVSFDGKVYFAGHDPERGRELWSSDGTAEGTGLVKDLSPGSESSSPSALAVVGETLYFFAITPEHGDELWSSDGTAEGTGLVKDLTPGPASSNPRGRTSLGGTLVFFTSGSPSGVDMWRTDGTEAGTSLLKHLPGGVFNYVQHAGTLLLASVGSSTTDLWRSDGTEAGTVLVTQLPSPGGMQDPIRPTFYTAGDYVYFTDTSDSTSSARPGLYRTDGTAEGTILLDNRRVEQTAVAGGRFFYTYEVSAGRWDAPIYSKVLAVSDGTVAGTRELKQFTRGLPTLAAFGGTLYFSGSSPAGGELWRSDGTPEGTALVKLVVPGPTGGVSKIVPASEGVYLSVLAADGSRSLWKSDGTGIGTVPVMAGVTFQGGLQAGGAFFFNGSTPAAGAELWKTDGTLAGTALVKDINLDTRSSFALDTSIGREDRPYFTAYNGATYFGAYDPVNGRALWRTDGTPTGTALVRVFGLNAPTGGVKQLTVAGGTLYFVNWDGTLFRSNGVAASTYRVLPNPGQLRSVSGLTAVGSNLLFFALDARGVLGLYRTDGTPAGTALLLPLGTTAQQTLIRTQLAVGGQFFFIFSHGLYRSNGTPGGTTLVRLIYGTYSTSNLVAAGKYIFFSADGKVWRTDGTGAGTFAFGVGHDITAAGGKAYFLDTYGRLWVTNGTPTGSLLLPFFEVRQKVNWLGTLAFLGRREGETTSSLWRTNGTVEGTARLASLPSGYIPPDGAPAVYRNSLYFVIDDGTHGQELWASDGTAAGTGLVQDIFAGGGSRPRDLTVAGGRLYFTAHDGPLKVVSSGTSPPSPDDAGFAAALPMAVEPRSHGREVWFLTPPPFA